MYRRAVRRSATFRIAMSHLTLEADSGLLVPLVYAGRSVDVLESFDRVAGGPEFSAEDEGLLQASGEHERCDRLRLLVMGTELDDVRWRRVLCFPDDGAWAPGWKRVSPIVLGSERSAHLLAEVGEFSSSEFNRACYGDKVFGEGRHPLRR
jgi:hypothetical protein